jgi:hypothetical protein
VLLSSDNICNNEATTLTFESYLEQRNHKRNLIAWNRNRHLQRICGNLHLHSGTHHLQNFNDEIQQTPPFVENYLNLPYKVTPGGFSKLSNTGFEPLIHRTTKPRELPINFFCTNVLPSQLCS